MLKEAKILCERLKIIFFLKLKGQIKNYAYILYTMPMSLNKNRGRKLPLGPNFIGYLCSFFQSSAILVRAKEKGRKVQYFAFTLPLVQAWLLDFEVKKN